MTLQHRGLIIRPPSEAESLLLQVTFGCSHNKCAFCGAYKVKKFSLLPAAEIEADLLWAKEHFASRKVFLCDGDALILPFEQLRNILQRIKRHLPKVIRISSYASPKSIASRSEAELTELRALGLKKLYLGLESGHNPTLERMRKGFTAEAIAEQARRVLSLGFKLNTTVILGLAGRNFSREHAESTAALLNTIRTTEIAALTLMPIPKTPLANWIEQGSFILLSSEEILQELSFLLSALDSPGSLFLANHASNYLSLKLRLPRDKDYGLELIRQALKGELLLREEGARRL